MNISKTTFNYAKKRNVALYLDDEGNLDFYAFDFENQECSDIQYRLEDDVFVFVKQWNKELEDMPLYIKNEKKLREVINYISGVSRL